jgi:hypothetical protein
MELRRGAFCEELLLDIIYYEILRGHLSPEMKYIFKRHLKQCSKCRHRYFALLCILKEESIVRNFG